jgi:hypothetical protein
VEAELLYQETLRRRPELRATVRLREGAKAVVERHYRRWRQRIFENLNLVPTGDPTD